MQAKNVNYYTWRNKVYAYSLNYVRLTAQRHRYLKELRKPQMILEHNDIFVRTINPKDIFDASTI